MDIFKQSVSHLVTDAFEKINATKSYTPDFFYNLVSRPPNPEMGDYALPCFEFSKILRKDPKLIASELASVIQDAIGDIQGLTSVQAAGPYLNFTISMEYMASITLPGIADGSYFSANRSVSREKIMIEYSQPNTHKGFHVGHIRNVALGDCLCRIFRYNGYDVVAANYIGDVGAHIAKCLWYYLNYCTESPPDNLRGEWLGTLYTKATRKLEDASPEQADVYNQEISKILQSLEADEPGMKKTWEETRQWSLDDFAEIYKWLDTKFNYIFYESEVDAAGKQLVVRYLEKEIFEQSRGAIGINLDDADLGYFLLLKSDGNTLYSTKDLALAQKKIDEFQIDRSIYIVGAEQTLHFKQVFETLKRMGYSQAEKCFHLPYALVTLPTGKMSSRVGNIILFSQLRNEMNQYIQTNYLNQFKGKWNDAEIEETTRRVAIASIKYGMLKHDTNQQIVFSMKDWLVSEGNTGVYLIYAYVRIRSIGKKTEQNLTTDVDYSLLTDPEEKLLIRQLFDFNEIVLSAGTQYRPSLLANALFDMAKTFNRAYRKCSVKYAESAELQSARWLLFHCAGETLRQGLFLLGITPPERM